jgi:hypothetical protein
MDDYSAYIGLGHNSQPHDLAEITKLAEKQFEIEKRIAELESQLEKAKAELKTVAENQLPEAMEQVGLGDYTTTTGIYVKVAEEIRASLAAKNRPKGFDWLEKNNAGGVIKSKVIIEFPRSKLTVANELVQKLRNENLPANLERKVEFQTLQCLIKDKLSNGEEVPLDIFSVHRQRVAKVKAGEK